MPHGHRPISNRWQRLGCYVFHGVSPQDCTAHHPLCRRRRSLARSRDVKSGAATETCAPHLLITDQAHRFLCFGGNGSSARTRTEIVPSSRAHAVYKTARSTLSYGTVEVDARRGTAPRLSLSKSGRLLLSEWAKVVGNEGIAPSSSGCKPAALLLS